MHTPVEVTARAVDLARALGADCTVAVGGGSTTGLGKAIALATGLDQIVVPTTYAGSEMTPILGQTERGVKTTQRSPAILPEVVIYDVDLTLTLPPALTATSGLNAIAHAVEALYAQDRNPIVSLMAEEGIAALARSLPVLVDAASDWRPVPMRSTALGSAAPASAQSAWPCTTSSATRWADRSICPMLRPTRSSCRMRLPTTPPQPPQPCPASPALSVPATRRGRSTTSQENSAHRVRSVNFGMPEEGIERAADLAVQNPYWNPRPVERDAVRDLLARAWSGAPPQAEPAILAA
jgi:alcohol dehydrogenase class IV